MSSTWINQVFPSLLKKKIKEMSEEGGENQGSLCVTTDSKRAQEITSRIWWHCQHFSASLTWLPQSPALQHTGVLVGG